MASSSSNHSQKRSKAVEMEEIVRHMSNLPSYLERGKPVQDRALNFGVMDWGRLEKWQYHRQKEGVFGNNKYSVSSSNSSLLSSTNESSPRSSKGQSQSYFPAFMKPDNHVTLQSHLNISPEEISTRGGIEASVNDLSKKKSSNRSRTKPRDCKIKMNDSSPRNPNESKSSDDLESFQTASSSSSSKGKTKIEESSASLKNSGISKSRNISPRHRFSFNTSSIATKAEDDATPVFQNSRKHTSPLKRLLDPLFQSKSGLAETIPEDSKTKAKVKLDFGSCKEVKIEDSCRNNNKANEPCWSMKQGVFQMAIKNGRPLFTFAVDNNVDILAATVRSLSGKDESNSWIYTFFTIQEVKKKKNRWLSQSNKGIIGQGFLPNVTAQMKVTNPSVLDSTTREFVLSSVEPGELEHEIFDSEPRDEVAAIVVRFIRKSEEEENGDGFSTTVILPGGHHSVPSKGEPSPLIERWRSGGVCDCGGWDVGCRLTTLTNDLQSERRRSNSKFELFIQGDVINEKPYLSISALKEGIFSVEYNSCLSVLHAFSICISVMECRKSCQHTEVKTYVAKQVENENEEEEEDESVNYRALACSSPVERV